MLRHSSIRYSSKHNAQIPPLILTARIVLDKAQERKRGQHDRYSIDDQTGPSAVHNRIDRQVWFNTEDGREVI